MPDPTLIPIDLSTQTPEPAKKKKRGAQPGNRNALKHGLYIHGTYLNNLNLVEQATLNDCNDLITHIKSYIEYTYSVGLKTKNVDKVNLTLRSLSLAGLSLSRLLSMQQKHSSIWLSSTYRREGSDEVDRHSFIRGLMRDLDGIVDLSELEDMINTVDEKHAAQPRIEPPVASASIVPSPSAPQRSLPRSGSF